MTKIILITISFFSTSICYGQIKFGAHLEKIEGIWIESSFKNYFDSIPSMMEYSMSLARSQRDISIYPIGLRIQSNEQKQGVLNIGYGVLHSHLLHPEVSKACIQNNDTIYEQGSFSIKLNQTDSSGYYKIPDLMDLYAIGSSCYMKISYQEDTTITILRTATEQIGEIIIKFKRVTTKFTHSYPYPNPRDYYVREKTLVGTYVLKDSMDEIISSNFTISPNGMFNSTGLWANRKIEFVTDVFCGGPAIFDTVIIYDPNNINKTDVELYIYKRKDENQIQFLSYFIDNHEMIINKPAYTLINKNKPNN